MESSDYALDSDAPSPKKRYKCTQKGCNASFSKNNKLTYHIRKHTGERPFACDEAGCSKTYTNSSHLTRHKKTSHESQSQPQTSFVCEHEGCGIVLANKYSLKKHNNTKHNLENYPFICGDCSQGFYRKRQLQQHVYIHTGEAPFQCDQCEMTFTAYHRLTQHKKRHRTHTCDCSQVFNRWSDFLSHKKTCMKPRFKCDICEKPFSQLTNLKNHKLTHKKITERMVYVCPYADCKRFYFYKRNIKYHINYFHKRINGNVTYGCTYPKCPVKLKTKQSLRMHLQRHFKWVQKKQRRLRHDKGKPRKSMISVLTGQEQAEEKNSKSEGTLEKQSEKRPRGKIKLKKTKISISTDSEQLEENNSEIVTTPQNASGSVQISLSEDVTDEVLLRQCDLTLAALHEEVVIAT